MLKRFAGLKGEYSVESLYCCLVKMGHYGHKKHVTKKFIIRSQNAVDAMMKAKQLPGVKKGCAHLQGQSVLEVYPVKPYTS
ncbi:MAG: hypothetical protein N3A72_01080 [bacterium]|nr:hypothetical protein [bacterium]